MDSPVLSPIEPCLRTPLRDTTNNYLPNNTKKCDVDTTPRCQRTINNKENEVDDIVASSQHSTPKKDCDAESDTTAEYESAGEASPFGKETNISALASCLEEVHLSTPSRRTHAQLSYFPFSPLPVQAEDESDEEVTSIISRNGSGNIAKGALSPSEGELSRGNKSLNNEKNVPVLVVTPSQARDSRNETSSDKSFTVIKQVGATSSVTESPNKRLSYRTEQNLKLITTPDKVSPSLEFEDAGPACSFHSEVMNSIEAQLLSGTPNSSLVTNRSLISEGCRHSGSDTPLRSMEEAFNNSRLEMKTEEIPAQIQHSFINSGQELASFKQGVSPKIESSSSFVNTSVQNSVGNSTFLNDIDEFNLQECSKFKENLDEICQQIESTNLSPLSVLFEKDDFNFVTQNEKPVAKETSKISSSAIKFGTGIANFPYTLNKVTEELARSSLEMISNCINDDPLLDENESVSSSPYKFYEKSPTFKGERGVHDVDINQTIEIIDLDRAEEIKFLHEALEIMPDQAVGSIIPPFEEESKDKIDVNQFSQTLNQIQSDEKTVVISPEKTINAASSLPAQSKRLLVNHDSENIVLLKSPNNEITNSRTSSETIDKCIDSVTLDKNVSPDPYGKSAISYELSCSQNVNNELNDCSPNSSLNFNESKNNMAINSMLFDSEIVETETSASHRSVSTASIQRNNLNITDSELSSFKDNVSDVTELSFTKCTVHTDNSGTVITSATTAIQNGEVISEPHCSKFSDENAGQQASVEHQHVENENSFCKQSDLSINPTKPTDITDSSDESSTSIKQSSFITDNNQNGNESVETVTMNMLSTINVNSTDFKGEPGKHGMVIKEIDQTIQITKQDQSDILCEVVDRKPDGTVGFKLPSLKADFQEKTDKKQPDQTVEIIYSEKEGGKPVTPNPPARSGVFSGDHASEASVLSEGPGNQIVKTRTSLDINNESIDSFTHVSNVRNDLSSQYTLNDVMEHPTNLNVISNEFISDVGSNLTSFDSTLVKTEKGEPFESVSSVSIQSDSSQLPSAADNVTSVTELSVYKSTVQTGNGETVTSIATISNSPSSHNGEDVTEPQCLKSTEKSTENQANIEDPHVKNENSSKSLILINCKNNTDITDAADGTSLVEQNSCIINNYTGNGLEEIVNIKVESTFCEVSDTFKNDHGIQGKEINQTDQTIEISEIDQVGQRQLLSESVEIKPDQAIDCKLQSLDINFQNKADINVCHQTLDQKQSDQIAEIVSPEIKDDKPIVPNTPAQSEVFLDAQTSDKIKLLERSNTELVSTRPSTDDVFMDQSRIGTPLVSNIQNSQSCDQNINNVQLNDLLPNSAYNSNNLMSNMASNLSLSGSKIVETEESVSSISHHSASTASVQVNNLNIKISEQVSVKDNDNGITELPSYKGTFCTGNETPLPEKSAALKDSPGVHDVAINQIDQTVEIREIDQAREKQLLCEALEIKPVQASFDHSVESKVPLQAAEFNRFHKSVHQNHTDPLNVIISSETTFEKLTETDPLSQSEKLSGDDNSEKLGLLGGPNNEIMNSRASTEISGKYTEPVLLDKSIALRLDKREIHSLSNLQNDHCRSQTTNSVEIKDFSPNSTLNMNELMDNMASNISSFGSTIVETVNGVSTISHQSVSTASIQLNSSNVTESELSSFKDNVRGAINASSTECTVDTESSRTATSIAGNPNMQLIHNELSLERQSFKSAEKTADDLRNNEDPLVVNESCQGKQSSNVLIDCEQNSDIKHSAEVGASRIEENNSSVPENKISSSSEAVDNTSVVNNRDSSTTETCELFSQQSSPPDKSIPNDVKDSFSVSNKNIEIPSSFQSSAVTRVEVSSTGADPVQSLPTSVTEKPSDLTKGVMTIGNDFKSPPVNKPSDSSKSPLKKRKDNSTEIENKNSINVANLTKSSLERKSYEDLLDKCLEQERMLGFDISIKEEAEKIAMELADESSPESLPPLSQTDSTPSPSKNISEAGPTTADLNLNNADTFQDAATFDFEYLSKIRGKPGHRQLARESLFLKFDPLATASTPESEISADQNHKQPDRSADGLATPPRPPANGEEQLINITPCASNVSPVGSNTPRTKRRPSSGNTTPSFRQEILSKEVSRLQDMMIKQEFLYQEQIAACIDEIEELRSRIAELESQDTVEDLESRIVKAEGEIEELTVQVKQLDKEKKELLLIVKEYDYTVTNIVQKRELERQKCEEEKDEIARDRDQTNQHLRNMEICFNDIHKKYEKCKEVIQAFKHNEEQFRTALAENEKIILQNKENYLKLKEHASQKLEEANKEIVEMKKAHQAEIAKLTAINRKMEIKVKSLEDSLEQKKKEVAELTKICDELITKFAHK